MTAVNTSPALPLPRSAHWEAAPGPAVIFVDGLRYDVAAWLRELLAAEDTTLDWQFAANPTLTPTAKPAVTPIQGDAQVHHREKLSLSTQGKVMTASVLRDTPQGRGFIPVMGQALPAATSAAWLEIGDLDSLGHHDGVRLPVRLPAELERLRRRVLELMSAGFHEIRIITDHGWLLPGGLPKVDLPASLDLFKKGRCALLKEPNTSAYPTRPWTWDETVNITLAPGISSFEAGQEYTHGGLSLQESVTPILTVKREGAALQVEFSSVNWVNNRCKVQVTDGSGIQLDLRRKASDASTSLLTTPKKVAADGTASLLAVGDDLEGSAAFLVALRGEQVLRQQVVTVGVNA